MAASGYCGTVGALAARETLPGGRSLLLRSRSVVALLAADAMGRPELLAKGISQALLTTAAGLSVAIPALIAYLFFVSRVDRLIMDIDALGQELVDLISADARTSEESRSGRSRNKAA